MIWMRLKKYIRKSMRLCEPWDSPSATCRCYIVLARILQNQGKLPEAGEALHLAEASIRGHSPVTEIISDLNAAQVGFWLATGQTFQGIRMVARFQQKPSTLRMFFPFREKQDEITQARVLVAEGKLEIALQSLERLAVATERGGRIGHLIEIRKLQALALQARGDHQQALDMLQKSLALAEPEGYIRIFVDEGEPMQEMLLAYLHADLPGNHTAYAQKLLAAFTTPVQ